jgi:DNA-binding response OmpR family regulator/nitrogen-specific signal transduction histidine kinase
MTLIFAIILAARYAKVFNSLEKAHSDLLVLDKMKDDFLATTSHELRTPLHGIIGLTESLADGSLGQVSGAQKENLELIRSSASHLTTLVNEILDFSRLRAGRTDLYVEKTRVEDIAATVVSLLKQSAAQKGVRLELETKNAPEISADRNRLRQVLINLVGNAVKFTEKGEIRVTVEPSPDGGVRVAVRDTGRGIAAKDLARMWNPFEQAEDPDTRKTGGTGLGLAITKYLVELHGGTIRAESEPGKGSAFIFEMPAEPPSRGIQKAEPRLPEVHEKAAAFTPGLASTGAEAREAYRPRRGVSSAEILAVDDDPVSLRVVENLCRVVGYDIVTASSGPGALAIMEERDIDLVLLDLMLPGMSGFEVCQKMRSSDRLKHVPVIMVTARDAAGDLIRGFSTGANDYVTKPFNREELLVRMENQLVIKQMLDMEKSVINGLRQEKDAITNLYQRSQDLKESTLQMVEWERIVREDLHIAESFQHRLMTHEKGIRGLESHVLYRPLMQIGGDLYDIFEFRPGVVRVFLADATGHGITASLNTVKILSEYAAVKETLSSPEVVLNYLNRRFIQIFRDYQIVFTCVVADIDLNTGQGAMVSAGHPEMYHLGAEGVRAIKPRGPIIGLSRDYEYRQSEISMAAGDIILLYTDGLLELIDAQYKRAAGPDFDEADIMKRRLVRLKLDRSLEEFCGLVMNPPEEEVPARGRGDDDITIIALRRT